MLHVVDLDGAFGKGENAGRARAIARAVDVPVQTGGGCVRAPTSSAPRGGRARGRHRQLMVENPPRRGRSSRHSGRASSPGSTRAATASRCAVGKPKAARLARRPRAMVAAWGVQRVVYTEIARDGMGSGYDVAALAHVAARTAANHRQRRREDTRRFARGRAGTPAKSMRRSSGARSTRGRSISGRRSRRSPGERGCARRARARSC